MKKLLIFTILIIVLVSQGCSKEKKTDASDEAAADDAITPTVTQAPAAAEAAPTEVITQAPTAVPTTAVTVAPEPVLPVADNTTGKVLIQTVSGSRDYPLNSYILSSAEGENVVIDPAIMPSKDIVDLHPAAITHTHDHYDHVDEAFSASYDCPDLSCVEGILDTKDFHIYSIITSHFGDMLKAFNKNVIIVYEVDGIRIAQLGDIGQTKFTDDQLDKLGDIDIAIAPINNSYSGMTLENEKGFNLLNQLKPKIIITMNEGEKDLAALKEHYGDITEVDNMLAISKDDLPETTCNVYHITNTHTYN